MVNDDLPASPPAPSLSTPLHETQSSDIQTALLADSIPVPDSPPPTPPKQSFRDIGSHVDAIRSSGDISGSELKTDKQRVLREIFETIGTKQVSRSRLSFAPDWILREAFEEEMRENWTAAFEVVSQDSIPSGANIIGCHTVYKVKEDGDVLRLKARSVLHGNRDRARFAVRRDSASADLSVIRLVLSLGVVLGFSFGTADVKGAYMQSGPIKRDLYVRPPKEYWSIDDGKDGRKVKSLWMLLKLPYGIVEAGRQWLCAIENWMLSDYGMERVRGVDQLFVKRLPDTTIGLLVAKVVDDFLLAGIDSEIRQFLEHVHNAFTLGSTCIETKLRFLGCEIDINKDGSVNMGMHSYLERIKPISVSRGRRHLPHSSADDRERSEYRTLAGTLLYLGQAVLPQACYVASRLQQRLGSLTVRHLLEGNEMLRELSALRAQVTFRRPGDIDSITVCTISDASHGGNDSVYGQTGIICGLRIVSRAPKEELFHPLVWSSHKQRRVSYSSFGAEILAAAAADDRGYEVKRSIFSIFPESPLRHEIMVDSKALFETITTLHQGDDYRLRGTVARMRDLFESQELNSLRWIPGIMNVADALTKRNLKTSALLNQLLADGRWCVDISDSAYLDSETWC